MGQYAVFFKQADDVTHREAEKVAGRQLASNEDSWRCLWGEAEKQRINGVAASLLEKVMVRALAGICGTRTCLT